MFVFFFDILNSARNFKETTEKGVICLRIVFLSYCLGCEMMNLALREVSLFKQRNLLAFP